MFKRGTVGGGRRRVFRWPEISKTKISMVLLFIFAALVGYTIFFSGIFQMRVVAFEPEQIVCVDKTKVVELLPKNENLLFIKASELSGNIKAKYPCLEYVTVEKRFPETLRIMVSERKMAAVLKAGVKEEAAVITSMPIEATPSSSSAKPVEQKDEFAIEEYDYPDLFSVDLQGFVLAKEPTDTENLPTYYYQTDHALEVNQWLAPNMIKNAITLSNKLKEFDITIQTQKIVNNSLYIDGSQRIIFLLEKDPSAQIIPLQLILQKAKIDGALIEKIDLRFDKPVVVYKKKQA